jgi:hypothetical protein
MTPQLVVVRPAPRSERITIFVSKDTKKHLVTAAAAARKETGSRKIRAATIAADYVELAALRAERTDAPKGGAGIGRRSTDHAA